MATMSRSPFPTAWLPQGGLQAPGCHGGHRPGPLGGITRRAWWGGLLPQRMAAATMRRPRLTAPFVSPPGGQHKTKRPVSAARGKAWRPARGGPCWGRAAGTAPAQPSPRGPSGVLRDPSCGQGSAMAGGSWGSWGGRLSPRWLLPHAAPGAWVLWVDGDGDGVGEARGGHWEAELGAAPLKPATSSWLNTSQQMWGQGKGGAGPPAPCGAAKTWGWWRERSCKAPGRPPCAAHHGAPLPARGRPG